MLFGHLTHEVPKEILMAWKEDRTRDRDLEILCVMETAWAIAIEAMEKGEDRKRGQGYHQHTGREMVSRTQGENWQGDLFTVGEAKP